MILKIDLIFTNSVDSLARKEYDLLVADLTMTHERVDKIDFTVPFRTSNIIIIFKRSSLLDSDYLAVFQPLSLKSWLAIFGAMISGEKLLIKISALTFFPSDNFTVHDNQTEEQRPLPTPLLSLVLHCIFGRSRG